MYNLIFSNEFVIPTFFCCILIMLGSYFLLNLMLAVIMEQYIVSENEYSAKEQERLLQEKQQLDERIKQVQSMGDFVRLGTLLDKR